MFTLYDAVRSIQHYVSDSLGSEWEVRLAEEPGSWMPPFCAVSRVGALSQSGPAWYTDVSQTVALHCYPEPGDSIEASITRSLAVEELLHQAFNIGVGDGRPSRIPSYDYVGVPEHERSEKREEHHYLAVPKESFSTEQLPDPQNGAWRPVVCTFRVQWRRAGRLRSGGNLVESVSLRPLVK